MASDEWNLTNNISIRYTLKCTEEEKWKMNKLFKEAICKEILHLKNQDKMKNRKG